MRSRIDLKYLLALPLEDSGFDSSVLYEFHARLIEGNNELLVFNKLLERFHTHKLLPERGKQGTDSTHALTAVHTLNPLSCAGQTFRNALKVPGLLPNEHLMDMGFIAAQTLVEAQQDHTK